MKLSVQPEQATQGARFVVVDEHGDILLTTFDNTEQSRALALLASVAPEMLAALGITLGLITKHGLAVTLAKEHPEDFQRLQSARAAIGKAEGRADG